MQEKDYGCILPDCPSPVPIHGNDSQFWFNPLLVLAEETGTDSAVYAFWFNACGGICPTYLLNESSVCAQAQLIIDNATTDPCFIIRDNGVQAAVYWQALYLILGCHCQCTE